MDELEKFRAYLCRTAKWYFDSDYLEKLNRDQLAWYINVMSEMYDGVPRSTSSLKERRESFTRKNRMRRDVYYIIDHKTTLDEFLESEKSPRWREENSLRVYDASAGRKEKRKRRKSAPPSSVGEGDAS
jgi:hypothetical protein